MKKYVSLHSFTWLLLFVLMPATYVEKYLLDYESAPRFILLSLLCLVCSVVFLRQKNQTGFHFVRTPYFFTAGTFLLLAAIQLLPALNPGEAAREWIRFALMFFLIFILYRLIRQKPELRSQVIAGLVIAALIFIVLGFWEKRAALLKFFSEGTAIALKRHEGSTLVNKNFFAETLSLCFPFAVAGVLIFKRWMRYVSLLCSVLSLLILIFLQYISAWLALACSFAGVCVLLLITGKKIWISVIKSPSWLLPAVALIALVGIIFFKYHGPGLLKSKLTLAKEYLVHPPEIISYSDSNKNSIFERYMLTHNTLLLIKDHWVKGVGMANWRLFFPQYGISGMDFINHGSIHYDHPHNDFLFIWSELGLAGILLYLLLFLLPLKNIVTAIKNSQLSGPDSIIMVAAFFSILSFLVLSLSEFPRLRMYSMVVTAVACALALSIKQNDSERKRFNPRLLFVFIAVVSAVAIYAGVMKFNGEYHMKREFLYRVKGKFDNAEKESRLARSYFFTADLTGTPLYWYTGVDNFYGKNPDGAMYYFKKAEEESPYHALVLKDLGTLYSEKGEYDTALIYYDKALQVRPLFYEVLLNKSAVYYNMRNIDSAFATIKKIHNPRYRMNKRYVKILNEILYTKAFFLAQQLPAEEQKKFLEKIENPSWLISSYEPLLSAGLPFDSILIHNFEKSK